MRSHLKKLLIALLSVSVAFIYLNRKPSPQAQSPQSDAKVFKAVGVQKRIIQHKLRYSGTFEASKKIELHTPIEERVKKLEAQVGDWVQAGQILVRLEDQELLIQEKQKEAILKIKEAMIEEAQLRSKAKAQLLETARENFNARDIPKEKLDFAQNDYDINKAQLRVLEAEMKQAELELKKARYYAQQTLIRSPIHGILSKSTAHEGALAQKNTALLEILQTHVLKLIVNMEDRDFWRFLKAQQSINKPVIEVLVQSSHRKLFGQFRKVDPEVNPSTRTIRVEIAVKNKDNTLKPGMYAEILIHLNTEEEILYLPRSAVYFNEFEQKYYTQKVKGKTVKIQVLEVEAYDTDHYKIVQGSLLNDIGDKDFVINPYNPELRDQESVTKILYKQTQ